MTVNAWTASQTKTNQNKSSGAISWFRVISVLMFSLFLFSIPISITSFSANRPPPVLQGVPSVGGGRDRGQHSAAAVRRGEPTRPGTVGQGWLCTRLWPQHSRLSSLLDDRRRQPGRAQSEDCGCEKRGQWRVSMPGKFLHLFCCHFHFHITFSSSLRSALVARTTRPFAPPPKWPFSVSACLPYSVFLFSFFLSFRLSN